MSNPAPLLPVYPRPKPYTANVLVRLRRGLHSWLGLLNEWDFRVPLGALKVLGQQLFLVNEPGLVRQVLVDQVEQFPKHPYTLWILQPLIGRAIFSVNGKEWARQRRLLDQAFQLANLRRVFPLMEAAVQAQQQRLAQVLAGGEGLLNLEAEMTLVTADVIVRTIFSRSLEAAEAEELLAAFQRYQRRAGQALVLRLLRLPEVVLQRSLERHARPIRTWIRGLIDQRIQAVTPPQDLLQALIEAVDPDTGSRFGPEDLLDQVCFLFLAGHETSASALGMAAYLLARFPDAQQRLRAEVQVALAGASRPLAFEDLPLMPYGAALFQETLRLYPPVSFLIREATAEAELGASRCPMRALLTISPWVIQRHEQHWSDPHAFRPERFLAAASTAEERRWSREAFLPFGLGPRKCPGAAFALQEALLVLAELVRRYELRPDPSQQPHLVARLTLRSGNGIQLQVAPLN